MLNVSEELEGYEPIDLKAIENYSSDLSENTMEAIHLFNKALDDMQSGSEDMAIIALKKAISLHPAFYEAMNLLGLCYLATGNDDKGRAAFKKVIEADDSSIKAMQYLNKLDVAGEPQEGNTIAVKRKNSRNTKTQKNTGLFGAWLAKGLQSEDNNLYGLKYILGLLVGILLMGFIWYMVPTNKSLLSFERVENIVKNPELEKQIEQLTERTQKLEQDLKERKEENLKLMDSFQSYKDWVARLDQADNEYKSGKFAQSADLLMNKQGTTIPDDLMGRQQELWDTVRIAASEQLYQEGNKIYNGNTANSSDVYRQALEKYENALIFIEQDKVSYLPALYYQAGKAAARSNALERAVELFEALTRDFTNSQYSSYANSRLKEIESGQPIKGN